MAEGKLTGIVEAAFEGLTRAERAAALAELKSLIDRERFALAAEDVGRAACRECGSLSTVKRGKTAAGTQRYLCKDCGRSFTVSAASVFARSKLPSETWMRFAECFVDRLPLRECAQRCGVGLKTAFFMRHRVLESLFENLPAFQVKAGCGSQLDETFFRENFKGNHGKGDFMLPRPARKRGGSLHVRGISKEQICVLTGVNDAGDMFYEVACRGRLDTATATDLLTGRIGSGALVATDKLGAYPAAMRELGVAAHAAFDSKEGKAHLNHVNNLHSRIEGFIAPFKGVSTKHLAAYMAWFKWMECFRSGHGAGETAELAVRQLAGGTYQTPWRGYKLKESPFMDYWETRNAAA